MLKKIIPIGVYLKQNIGKSINYFIYKNKITIAQPFYIHFGGMFLGIADKKQVVIGKNFYLEGKIFLFENASLTIGEYSSIGRRTVLEVWSHMEIGSYTMISSDVYIQDNNSHSIFAQDRLKEILRSAQIQGNGILKGAIRFNDVIKPIKIGDHVWVGRGSTILKGVTIGNRSIIATGSVVTNDVPDDVIVAGNPARIVKKIKNNTINIPKALKELKQLSKI